MEPMGSAPDATGSAPGSVGSSDEEASSTFPTTGKPLFIEPTPGLMLASPAALHLGPGQTPTLRVQRVGADGALLDAPSGLTWLSSAPAVLAVAEDGSVTPVGVGIAVVRVTDADGRESSVVVQVSAVAPPSEAFALQCAAPVRVGRVGEDVDLGASITGPDGTVLAEPGVSYAVRGSAEATISDGGVVRAAKPGVAIVSAVRAAPSGGTEALAGECIVTFGESQSGAQEKFACSNERDVAYCSFAEAPFVMSSAGLSQALRVTVIRGTDCGFEGVPTIEVGSPSEIALGVAGVVDVGAGGLMESIGPGMAFYRAFVDGVACDREASVYVGFDPSGTWSASCDNGDRGTLSVSPMPPYVLTRTTTAGVSSVTSFACFESTTDAFACNAAAGVGAGPYSRSYANYRCSEAAPCSDGLVVATCHDVREPVLERQETRAAVTGPDSFRSHSCSYVRGGGTGCSAEPEPLISLATVNVQGNTYEVSAMGDLGDNPDIHCFSGGEITINTPDGYFMLHTDDADGVLPPPWVAGSYPIIDGVLSGFGTCDWDDDYLHCQDNSSSFALPCNGVLVIDSVSDVDSIYGPASRVIGSFSYTASQSVGSPVSCDAQVVSGTFDLYCSRD